MKIEKMITRATEAMLDLQHIFNTFGQGSGELYPEIETNDERYTRALDLLDATLNVGQKKMLLDVDSAVGARIGTAEDWGRVTGIIVALRYAGFSDERIKAVMATILDDDSEATPAEESEA
jgi:hypothetical protein